MSAQPRHAAVDPAAEAAFRRAYRAGWLAATDALAQLLEQKQLPAAVAADVLRAHHAQALERWEHDKLGLAYYPPKIGRKVALAVGEGDHGA